MSTPQRQPIPPSRNAEMIAKWRAEPSERLLLITTTGRKSGNKHTVPLVFMRDGDTPVIAGSAAGAPKHPDWYLNLAANSNVTVEMKEGTFEARAVTAEGAERERLLEMAKEKMGILMEHQAKTTRVIPLVSLVKK